ncbi:DUF6090 family protein [Leeuwenhoekiella sp. NPDC079379]|uniref:DUF6090 family protein n=1 Tax=Leeuwenhoekiella sp. NPDC079379 TaxID=3364122 RepID=UPI0037C9B314
MKFFGKLRRKMILDGKFKNYIVYAFGEIVLIVLGILIAWKINNLNEIRKSEIVQVKIYESLYEELHTNLIVLDSAILRYTSTATNLQKSLAYVGLQEEQLSNEAKSVIIEMRFKNSNLSDEALSSINSTDKFQFIESDSLKILIAQYPGHINEFMEQEVKLRNITENKLKPLLEKHLSLVDMLPENATYKRIKSYVQESDYKGLLNNKEYQNSIINDLLQTKIQLKIAKSLREKTEELSLKLNLELNG